MVSQRLINWLAVGLLALGLGLRLFDLTDQPIDFHPTRQLRGAIVARGLYYQMLPQPDEQEGQLASEFMESAGQYEPPILEGVVAVIYLATGGETIWVARLVNILLWLVGGLALFGLARRIVETFNFQVSSLPFGGVCALAALAYYLVLPFAVQASRSFQPDPAMVVWLILAAFCFYRWSENRQWRWALLAGLLGGLAILTKAVAIYPAAGASLAIVLYASGNGRNFITRVLSAARNPQAWVLAVMMLTPTAIYYLSRGERAGEYFSSWTAALSHLLLQPSLYIRWLGLVQGLVGWLALLLALVGVWIALRRREARRGGALLLGWWGGYIAYGLFLPYQISTHSYYQLQLVPLVAFSLAPAAGWLLERLSPLPSTAEEGSSETGARTGHASKHSRIGLSALAGLSVLWLVYASWQALIPLYSRDYRGEPAYWQEIAAMLPQDGKIIALTQDYGYRLMYYGWRKVTLWPNRGEYKVMQLRGSDKEFQEFFAKRTEGKSYFLITAFNQFNDQPNLQEILSSNFPVWAQGPGYLIYDLRTLQN